MTFFQGAAVVTQPPLPPNTSPSWLDPQDTALPVPNEYLTDLLHWLTEDFFSLDPGTIGGEKPTQELVERLIGGPYGKVVGKFFGDPAHSGGDVISYEQAAAIKSQLESYSAGTLLGQLAAAFAAEQLLAPPQLAMWLTDP